MTDRLQILDEAADEANAAWHWYLGRSQDAGERFQKAFAHALEKIHSEPSHGEADKHGTRHCTLHKIPYLIVYREIGRDIQVIAVEHTYRRDAYRKRRAS